MAKNWKDYDPDNDVERLLREDSISKKRTGSGMFHNSGRRGGGTKGVSKMMMPSDFMSKKEKKEYMKKGEVKVYNIYEDIKKIPTFEEVKAMDKEAAKELLTKLRNMHNTTKLANQWGAKINDVYKLIRELDVPMMQRTGGRSRKDVEINAPVLSMHPEDEKKEVEYKTDVKTWDELMAELEAKRPVAEPIVGTKLVINGEYDKAEMDNRILGLVGGAFGKRFRVSLTIEEVIEQVVSDDEQV